MRERVAVAGYAERRVPRGTSRRWEVLMSDDTTHEHTPVRPHTAMDVRSEHRVLREMPESLLREIPLLDEGLTLERLHEYLDLHDPARASFRAEGGEIVRPGQRVVAHESVPDVAWDELCAACACVVGRNALRHAS
jgi:hypothetical protein